MTSSRTIRHSFVRSLANLAILVGVFPGVYVEAADPETPPASATELAQRVDELNLGDAVIRTKLTVESSGGKRVLQLQIKQRRTKTTNDLFYQVLWPNEHKGEAVILRQAQGASKGSIITPQQPARPIKPSQMNEGLFDSDLSYQDAVDNVYTWKKQAIVGAETVNGVECQILESKPDSSSAYGKVRSWIDPKRLVPLRIEKYSPSGELIRRIDVTRVAKDERHNPIPASLVVHGLRKDSTTRFDGSRIDQDVQLSDADFAPTSAAK